MYNIPTTKVINQLDSENFFNTIPYVDFWSPKDINIIPKRTLRALLNITVNIPNMSGFTVSDDGKSFSTQTTTYVISSNDYPWLDPLVKKIKRFSGILLILGYLVSLRYRLPEIVRGE